MKAPVRGRDPVTERQAVLVLAGAIALGVVVRLLTFRGQGFPSDVGTFMAWGQRMAAIGPAHFYAPGYFTDYPPGFLYVLWIVGAVFQGGEPMRLAVKALSIPADIALAIILFRLVRSYAGPSLAAAAGALWMLQPAPIFAGPFWGQVDAWGTLPYFLALIAAGRGRWATAGGFAALAAMIKPQFGLVGIVIAGGAVIELIRSRTFGPLVRVIVSGSIVAIAIALPFGLTPGAFIDLVKNASETYPYTSLYAFNMWSIVGDFWKPDDAYVVAGGALLALGVLLSIVTLWWRRDVAMFLVAGTLATAAFYFLPTRAHERYLYPALLLLVPFAVTRPRVLWAYLGLALVFFATLYFAFTRYFQNGLAAPPLLESTLFGRNGQIAMALAMIGLMLFITWRLLTGDARLEPDEMERALTPSPLAPVGEASAAWHLPAGLGRGHAPRRRDLILAIAIALAFIATRGFRLDQPRDMYFDEVYHARTAFELLAQREPYEWTHPHLAKEIMALGIMAFGGDEVASEEAAPRGITAFAVSGDGLRAYGDDGGNVRVTSRSGSELLTQKVDGAVRAVGFDGMDAYAVTDKAVWRIGGDQRSRPHGVGRPTSFAVTRGRAVVGGAQGVEIVPMAGDAAVLKAAIPTAALTARGDSGEIYVADTSGVVHIVEPTSGQETGKMTGGAGPVSAVAFANGPQRLYAATAGQAAIEWFEQASGQGQSGWSFGGTVPLSNGRTGELSPPITALAEIPRTDFVYALVADHSGALRQDTGGHSAQRSDLVVIETRGASPYAAINVHGDMMGVDGTADDLLVLGDGSIEHVSTGRHALSWRIPGVLFGGLLAFFVVLIARRLFASELVPILAGILVLLDDSTFATVRIGMNDVYVAAFLVAGWYFVIAAHAPRRSAALDLFLAGLLFGLGAASKWAAIYALAGLGLYAVIATAWTWSRGRPGQGGPFDLLAPAPFRRVPWRGGNAVYLLLCFLAVPLIVYLLAYVHWFGGPTAPYGWNLWELTQQMYWYHSGLTAPHPAGSPWWSWPLVLKPVYWYLGQPGAGQTAVIYNAGNIVLFWAALIAMMWAAIAAYRARSLALACLVFAFLTQYVAWIPISRVLFFYHFFTALPFYLLILAAALAALWESGRARAVTGYLALAAAAFVFFYPFVSGQPVPADQASMFYVLPTWQYDCQFYPSFHCDAGIHGDIPFQAIFGRVSIALGIALLGVAILSVLRDGDRVRAAVGRSLRRGPITQ